MIIIVLSEEEKKKIRLQRNAQNARYRARVKERVLKGELSPENVSMYVPTGYDRGRPLEPRLQSGHAKQQMRNRKDNEAWKEYNKKMQAEWRIKNYERSKEISRLYYQRKKQKLIEQTLITVI